MFIPSVPLDTTAFWVKIPPGRCNSIENVMVGLHGIEHAISSLMPLIVLCSTMDIGGVTYKRHSNLKAPSFFIYENYLWGVGLSETAYNRIEELLKLVYDTIKGCECSDGCPLCTQSSHCGSQNENLDKRSSVQILELILDKMVM